MKYRTKDEEINALEIEIERLEVDLKKQKELTYSLIGLSYSFMDRADKLQAHLDKISDEMLEGELTDEG